MTDNRNTILAVILSGLVLLGWQYFFNIPQMEKQRAAQQAQSELAKPRSRQRTPANARDHAAGRRAHAPAANAPAQPATAARRRRAAMPRSPPTPRVKIDTPRLSGSISLKGARIDDLSLVQFRETVDPASPAIVLYSPSGTAESLLRGIRLGRRPPARP